MKVLFKKDDYTLFDSGTSYVVAFKLNENTGECEHGIGYNYSGFIDKVVCLQDAIDTFRAKTEEKYISRGRVEELAALFKDGLIEDDRDAAMEYFTDTCDMNDKEKEWFGITGDY